jgi:hypothetical protein
VLGTANPRPNPPLAELRPRRQCGPGVRRDFNPCPPRRLRAQFAARSSSCALPPLSTMRDAWLTPAVAQQASLQPFCVSRPQAGRTRAGCFARQTSTFAGAGEVFAVVPLICLDTSLALARRARLGWLSSFGSSTTTRARPPRRTAGTREHRASTRLSIACQDCRRFDDRSELRARHPPPLSTGRRRCDVGRVRSFVLRRCLRER